MKTIYKYTLDIHKPVIKIHSAAQILSVGNQGEEIQIWAIVDTEMPIVNKRFLIAGTGHPLPDDIENMYSYEFVGTVQLMNGALVFHVFKQIKR